MGCFFCPVGVFLSLLIFPSQRSHRVMRLPQVVMAMSRCPLCRLHDHKSRCLFALDCKVYSLIDRTKAVPCSRSAAPIAHSFSRSRRHRYNQFTLDPEQLIARWLNDAEYEAPRGISIQGQSRQAPNESGNWEPVRLRALHQATSSYRSLCDA
jgi:hypothetical protein